ncbi:hypothetical protein MnTg02_03473 [bacterium MnTg02]|nr:hypothetical protein MnTg02_03473 [bacterium MnTg02]
MQAGCGVLLAMALFLFGDIVNAQSPEDLSALNAQVAQLYMSRKNAEATPIAERALALAQRQFGPDHPHVGTTLNNLALLYEAQGRTAEAELLYKRSLNIREKALGPGHPHVGTTLNNLAALYKAQGRTAEAELLYKRSITFRQKTVVSDRPDVGTSLNNLVALPKRDVEAQTKKKNLARKSKKKRRRRVCKQAFHVMRRGVCFDIR